MMKEINRTFCIAPMMDWSDRHCRAFWRVLTKDALLYTEMVTTGALIHSDAARFLAYNEQEHPLALQLGGSDPQDLARSARLAEQWGYDEVNLNCGCPSDRVQNGQFGACLMTKADLVSDCVKAMQDACELPVTVKHRIGIDDMQHYEQMVEFVEPIAATGCNTFIVHARKAWLQGLSPKENREIPPLEYPWVYRLKEDFPQLTIIINGGIENLESGATHLQYVDGIMMGRAAYHQPSLLAEVDQTFFGRTEPIKSAEQAVIDFLPYIESQLSQGVALNHISRHLLGIFQGVPGAKKFRRHISENAHRKGAGIEVIEQALNKVQQGRREAEHASSLAG